MLNSDEVCDTDELLRQIRDGDGEAREALLARHRVRLCRMVAIRIDRRIAARVDPSDVVQEAMRVAYLRLPEYLRDPQRPFYTWLRSLALDRLWEQYRRHVVAGKRSVRREQYTYLRPNDASESQLADRLVATSLAADERMLLSELHSRVREGLRQLSANDREMLVLRHLEQLSVQEIAYILEISMSAVTTRHLRALQRLRAVLGDDFGK